MNSPGQGNLGERLVLRGFLGKMARPAGPKRATECSTGQGSAKAPAARRGAFASGYSPRGLKSGTGKAATFEDLLTSVMRLGPCLSTSSMRTTACMGM